jgi:hypothetical protein
MGVSDEAKNVIPLKFLRKIKNKNVFPLVNSIRGRDGKYTSMFRIHRYISKKYRYFYIDVSISIYR